MSASIVAIAVSTISSIDVRDERLRDRRSAEARAVKPVAVMRDRSPPCADISAARCGLPGFTQPQLSMKICPPICSATVVPFCAIEPDCGAGMPALQIEIGGVLGRDAEAAPPIHAVLLGGIVEPGAAHIRSRRAPAHSRAARG